MNGPGAYDDLATLVRETAGASGVVIVVFSGDKGSGFSVQQAPPDFTAQLPGLLHKLATSIQMDLLQQNGRGEDEK